MDEVEGSRSFGVAGAAYDRFMGRYSRHLGKLFIDAAEVHDGQRALDVGCGPGALTEALVDRLGAGSVVACDPTAGFVAECRTRLPGVRVEQARAEQLPSEEASFDHALAQLVFHFVSEPDRAAAEMRRVTRPGGRVAACVWDFADGMEMLRAFWDAALALDRDAPDEARTLRFGRAGELADLFGHAGLDNPVESTLRVTTRYQDVDDLWAGFLTGVGPAGAYCTSLDGAAQDRLRLALAHRLGDPSGEFELAAVARCAVAQVPG